MDLNFLRRFVALLIILLAVLLGLIWPSYYSIITVLILPSLILHLYAVFRPEASLLTTKKVIYYNRVAFGLSVFSLLFALIWTTLVV